MMAQPTVHLKRQRRGNLCGNAQTGALAEEMLKLLPPFPTETMKTDSQLQRDVMADGGDLTWVDPERHCAQLGRRRFCDALGLVQFRRSQCGRQDESHPVIRKAHRGALA